MLLTQPQILALFLSCQLFLCCSDRLPNATLLSGGTFRLHFRQKPAGMRRIRMAGSSNVSNVKKRSMPELVLKYGVQIASKDKFFADVVGVGAVYPGGCR